MAIAPAATSSSAARVRKPAPPAGTAVAGVSQSGPPKPSTQPKSHVPSACAHVPAPAQFALHMLSQELPCQPGSQPMHTAVDWSHPPVSLQFVSQGVSHWSPVSPTSQAKQPQVACSQPEASHPPAQNELQLAPQRGTGMNNGQLVQVPVPLRPSSHTSGCKQVHPAQVGPKRPSSQS